MLMLSFKMKLSYTILIREQGNCPWIIAPRIIDPRTISPQDNCPRTIAPQDNCPRGNCLPKIVNPEIVPQIVSPWTTATQTIAPQNKIDY